MNKTYKYRLYPTKKQIQKLNWTLDMCRVLYNSCLLDRKNSYIQTGKGFTRIEQQKILKEDKKRFRFLNEVHSQVLQDVLFRVERAFQSFFRRVKANSEKPGYPRFKGEGRYDSIIYPQQPGFQLISQGLKLSKIGTIKIKLHRKLGDGIKTLTVRRTNNKWYACFSCEIESHPLPVIDKTVGIDVGIASFATLSTGEKINNPRFFKTDQKKLAKAQKRLSKTKKGTPDRKKQRKKVSRIHEKIANKRSDFAHKLSRTLVNGFQVITFEKLNIKDMMGNNTKIFGHKLNKSISDVAWSQFMNFTTYKAECAGRSVIFVNPRNTSKRCSRCGQLVEKTLADRVHSCSCGLVMDRDENAAINILALGTQSLGFTLEAPSYL